MSQQRHDNLPARPPRVLFVGGSGHHYLRSLLREGAESLLVEDGADAEATRAWGEREGVEPFPGTLAEAAREFLPDVVSVGAVYARNGDFVAEALRLGLPVVSDKPLTVSRKQLQEIEQLTSGPDAPAVVTEFDWRARPDLRAARAAIAAGRIGPVVLAIGQKTYRFGNRPAWYSRRDLYGGTMLWIASHALDAIDFATSNPEPPEVVCARGGNVSRGSYGTMEDHVTATLALPGGGTGVVHADLLNPAAAPTHGKDRLRIVGGSGELLIDEGRCILTTDDQSPIDITEQGESPQSLAQKLLDAAMDTSGDEDFGTAASLRSARLLLAAQEALDAHQT